MRPNALSWGSAVGNGWATPSRPRHRSGDARPSWAVRRAASRTARRGQPAAARVLGGALDPAPPPRRASCARRSRASPAATDQCTSEGRRVRCGNLVRWRRGKRLRSSAISSKRAGRERGRPWWVPTGRSWSGSCIPPTAPLSAGYARCAGASSHRRWGPSPRGTTSRGPACTAERPPQASTPSRRRGRSTTGPPSRSSDDSSRRPLEVSSSVSVMATPEHSQEACPCPWGPGAGVCTRSRPVGHGSGSPASKRTAGPYPRCSGLAVSAGSCARTWTSRAR